ncbi:GerMN domain-containing protein [Paenibacillus sp. N1-5-1-14]|uniref:GerMN domain-containing protein n=1 Tax=Paenibacillus radicibacter TaxID=2972488 RepID=UPI002158ED41|nr:GerMN domain-containing protein [Paenibacillus radicibacter]MCR8644204.1 GerMN domain-containing protein [Paenibacillus radicibacter]
MKRKIWIRSVAVTGTVAMLMSGCSMLGLGDKKAIDEPPQGSNEQQVAAQLEQNYTTAQGNQVKEPLTSPGVSSTSAQSQTAQTQGAITVYAKDVKGLVAPITLHGAQNTAATAKLALEYMVQGGPAQAQLPKGFTALLPQGTKVDVTVDKQKVATVKFSKEVLNYDAADERKMIEGIAWTLTSFPTIDKVAIQVDGKDLKQMPKAKLPLDAPVNRSLGINLEKVDGVDYGQTTAVTVYYMNQTDANYKYYVPVTRLVARTNDIPAAVMEQLIHGANSNKGLTSPVSAKTTVMNLKPSDGLLTVNLSKEILNAQGKAPAEALDAIILSLTESTNVSKVQLMVNNDVQFTSSDNKSYAKPVTRPIVLNATKS